MKLMTAFLAAGVALMAGDLAGVKAVYLMPMSGGLDQYLAIRLAQGGAMQVVTDPKKADAIFTDRIGANFEQSLQDMYAEKKKPSDGKQTTFSPDDFSKPSMQPLSHGKGSLFLVDRESRVVLWSIFAMPKTSDADELNRLAIKIADQLAKDRAGKK